MAAAPVGDVPRSRRERRAARAAPGGRWAGSQPALDPALQHRALDGGGVHPPAAQEAEVAVPQAPARAGGRLLAPVVQLEPDVHPVVEASGPLVRIVEALEQIEEEPVPLPHPLQLDVPRRLVEVPRRDHPGRQVAAVEGGQGHAVARSCKSRTQPPRWHRGCWGTGWRRPGADTIRRATEADVGALVALLGELFSIEADFRPEETRQRRGLALLLSSPAERLVLVAERGGEVAGMVTVQLVVSTAEGALSGLLEDTGGRGRRARARHRAAARRGGRGLGARPRGDAPAAPRGSGERAGARLLRAARLAWHEARVPAARRELTLRQDRARRARAACSAAVRSPLLRCAPRGQRAASNASGRRAHAARCPARVGVTPGEAARARYAGARSVPRGAVRRLLISS